MGVKIAVVSRSLVGQLEHYDQRDIADLYRDILPRKLLLQRVTTCRIREQRLHSIDVFSPAELSDEQRGKRTCLWLSAFVRGVAANDGKG